MTHPEDAGLKITTRIMICIVITSLVIALGRPADWQVQASPEPAPLALAVAKAVARTVAEDESPHIFFGQNIPGVTLSYHSETGKVRFIATQPGQPILQQALLPAEASPETAARYFLAAYGDLFGLQDQARELAVMRTQTLSGDNSFVRFQQNFQGVPVIAGELIVQVDAQGNIVSANGEILPDLVLSTTPRIDAETAQGKVLESIANEGNLEVKSFNASQPTLWIYNPMLLGGPGARQSNLVWRMEVISSDRLDFRELGLVDAQSGSVLLSFNQVDTAKYRKIYDNNNNSAYGLPGNGPVRVEGDLLTGTLEVDNAYDYAGFTYDYYHTFGRNSIDNAGMVLTQTVRYCPTGGDCPYPYAFWNGVQAVYGNGWASADDVVGHELTHGVTQFESNLFLYMQSGAINEAFSDIWGELIDQTYTNGHDNDTPTAKWLFGEDLPGGAIRSLSDPPAYNDPDRMTSSLYSCGTEDNGGVHTNSGVANKVAYLMVDGGSFNGFTATPVGKTKTARIFYEAQTHLLTSGSDYQDLHDSLIQACANLVNKGSVTLLNCQQVRNAIAAVEMNQQPTSCAVDHAPLCDNLGFNSQFKGSLVGWDIVSGGWYTDIDYLYTEGITNTWASVKHTNSFIDFDYRVKLQRLGCDGCANSILVSGSPAPISGSGDWYTGYRFQYTRSGLYSVSYTYNGNLVIAQDWTASGAIAQGNNWNTLRVISRNNGFYFYINNKLAWSGPNNLPTLGQVGISMYRDASGPGNLLKVDWATLTGGTPSTLFYDEIEAGLRYWDSQALLGADGWSWGNGYATSGSHMLYGSVPGSIADNFIMMNRDVTLPAGQTTYLYFNHAYDYGGTDDGGVLEYSTDLGSTWSDAGSLFTHNGYNGLISVGRNNPLSGYHAFVDTSHGYLSSRLDLSSLAGLSVRFRYRIGSDDSTSNLGWFIDDVRIYQCTAQAVYLPFIWRLFPHPGFNSQFTSDAAGWQVHSGSWSIIDGTYKTNGLLGTGSSVSYRASFSNFDYQVRMRRSWYAAFANEANRIMIRGTPDPLVVSNLWYNSYQFQYTLSGKFSIFKRVGGTLTALQDWTVSPAVIQGYSWNILRVVALGPDLYFYINGALVWHGQDIYLATGRTGFGLSNNGPLEIDWATLSPINSLAGSDTELSPEQQALNQAANQAGVGQDPDRSP